MNKAIRILAMCGLGVAIAAGVLALCAGHLSPSSAGATIAAAAFENGGFEGTYVQWGSVERLIAPSWQLWYADASTWPDEAGTIGPPKAYAETNRKHGGDKSQAVTWKDNKNFDACLYQQVPVTVGSYLQFSAWVYVDTTMAVGDMQTRIGIDPAGGTYPLDIQYELHPDNWDPLELKGQWAHLSVVMMATSPTATLYACAHPRWRMSFTTYWDDAAFATLPEKLTYVPGAFNEHCVVPPGTLWNSDLERDYCILHGYQEVVSGFHNLLTAPYWRPYWNDDFNPATAENRQPEANYTDRSYRIHSGSVAQQMGTSGGGNFEAGIYQVVTGTQPGDALRFTIWGLGWNQHWPANDPDGYSESVSDYQEEDGLRFRVGIDPYGGESYTSTHIVWSDLYNPFDQWHQFEITATAASTRVSVWAYAHPAGYWLRHNQTFWDGASLEVSSAE